MKDLFVFDHETHLMLPMDDISYFPNAKFKMRGLKALGRAWKHKIEPGKPIGAATADELIQGMDKAGVDMACVLPEAMLNISHGTRVMATNGYVAKEVEKYPERLVGVANVGPVIRRGVEDAIWEMEYLIKERGFKAVKLFPPEEDGPINDRRLWPYYKKIQELGVPLFVHTGWSYIMPGSAPNCRPIHLQDVIIDFPDIPIVAFHMGYPYHRELNMLAGIHDNLYIGTSLAQKFTFHETLGAPRAVQKVIGEAIAWATIDRVMWGSDHSPGPLSDYRREVEFLENFQIGEEVHRDYGFVPLSEEDRKKWAGLNLARLLNIKPRVFTRKEG